METNERFSDKRTSRLTRSEVVEQLQPVIGLHGIEVGKDHIKFPCIHPCVGAPEPGLPDRDSPVVVPFEDIASITPFNAHIEVLLYSGELYTFSLKDNIRIHVNTYKRGGIDLSKEKRPTTPKDIAENIWNGLDEILSEGRE